MNERIIELEKENENLKELVYELNRIANFALSQMSEKKTKIASLLGIPIAIYGYAKQHATLLVFLQGISLFAYCVGELL
jgi:hypothetical protein